MRLLGNNDGDLLSYVDKSDDSQKGIKGSPLNQMLNDNHEEAVHIREVKGQIFGIFWKKLFFSKGHQEKILGFCKTFRKIRKI